MTSASQPWQVQIQGWPSDLEHLARHFTSPPAVVVRDPRDNGFLYESEAFALCGNSEQVLSKADEELAVLSGVLRLERDSPEPLRTGAVYRQNANGGRDVFIHIREGIHVRVEVGEVTITTADAQGNVVQRPSPPPRTVLVARLAAKDAAVAKAMRLVAAPDFKTWVALYRVHEVIEADTGGEQALKKKRWGSAQDLKRFKHSANSVKVAGDAARHGREQERAPSNPMAIEEAAAYVRYLLEAWLESKGQNAP
jgi:hypothetical protein